MKYDKNSMLPSKALIECYFGDETIFQDDLDNLVEEGDDDLMFRYKIPHTYETNGEYNMTCK